MEHRVTVLEVKVEDLRSDNQLILDELRAIQSQLERYKGAWGAIVMIGGAVAAAITLGLKFIGK